VKHEELTRDVIGAAIEVHRALGPGLLEATYEACLAHELRLRKHVVLRQRRLPVIYKDLVVKDAFRVDLMVDDLVVVEIKSIEEFADIHFSQVATYLEFSEKPVGLLINFNVRMLIHGLRRLDRGNGWQDMKPVTA
jgi:GxxExxY protein